MTGARTTPTPSGRKKAISHASSPICDSAKPTALLGCDPKTFPAPRGRKTIAQGKVRSAAALGYVSEITSSPEAAAEAGVPGLQPSVFTLRPFS
jgi:hypothetical protein